MARRIVVVLAFVPCLMFVLGIILGASVVSNDPLEIG